MKVGDFITFSGCYHVEVDSHRHRFEMNVKQRKGVVVQRKILEEGGAQLKVFSDNEFCILNVGEDDCFAEVVNAQRRG